MPPSTQDWLERLLVKVLKSGLSHFEISIDVQDAFRKTKSRPGLAHIALWGRSRLEKSQLEGGGGQKIGSLSGRLSTMPPKCQVQRKSSVS